MNFLKSKILFLNSFVYCIILISFIIFDFFIVRNINSYYFQPYFKQIDNKYYCFSNHSVNRTIVKGWVKKGKKFYYFDDILGNMCINELKNIDNTQYIFDRDGILITNKKNYDFNGLKYDIDKNGVALKNNKK